MALRECEKCGEMVDDAKAFCPGCGESLVQEQKRSQSSNFEAMDSTVQLGQTMYNQMLSDMGLNISKVPDAPEKKVEILAPAAAAPVTPAAAKPVQPKPSNAWKWIIAALAVAVLLALLVVAVAALILIYMSRFS